MKRPSFDSPRATLLLPPRPAPTLNGLMQPAWLRDSTTPYNKKEIFARGTPAQRRLVASYTCHVVACAKGRATPALVVVGCSRSPQSARGKTWKKTRDPHTITASIMLFPWRLVRANAGLFVLFRVQ